MWREGDEMSVWKRAMLYLRRKKGRTALLGGLLLVMSCFVLVGISLKDSAKKQTDNLRQSLATGFVLKADTNNETYLQRIDGEGYSYIGYVGPRINREMIESIRNVEGVTDHIVYLEDLVWLGLNLRPGSWSDNEPSIVADETELKVWTHTTKVMPCTKGELHVNFKSGALTISQGRNIEEEDAFKAVISEWLAEENDLSVGDTITVLTKEGAFKPADNPMKTLGEPVELEIVGLFHMNFTQPASEYTPEDGYMENIIYSDLHTHDVLTKNLEPIYPEEEDYTRVTFFVEDPKMLDAIMQQVGEMEDVKDQLLLFADDSAYLATEKPYGQIRIFAAILLIGGMAGIGILLYLVVRMWVEGRMHEAGILLSIGIGRRKIVGQMLTEILAVAVAALVLTSLFSGVLVDKCADLAEQVTAPREDAEAYRSELSDTGQIVVTKTSAEKVKLEHGVSADVLLATIVLVCGISGGSVCLASIKITDMEPKQLLRSM